MFAENAGIRFMSEVRFFGDGGEGAEKEGEKKDEGLDAFFSSLTKEGLL